MNSFWSKYEPTALEPWNKQRVLHLHRRAAFGATWSAAERDFNDGPEASIRRLLDGQSAAENSPGDFERIAGLLGQAAAASRNLSRLKAWWVYRMLFSPDPLTERLTLMWHNHFATSNDKVNHVAAMQQQNDLFRRHAKSGFGELLTLMLKDPALLIWLDAQANDKEHPNENLARELMELFTLGVGHYSESDIREVARTLTGIAIEDGQYVENVANHDAGEKTIFGKTGAWNASHLPQMLLEHPASSKRLAVRICELLMSEGTVPIEAIQELADGLRAHDFEFRWAIETVLQSRPFFSSQNLGRRILGPVEFVVGTCRVLEIDSPPPNTLFLSEWTRKMGQDLFNPPNVFGWPGGRSWITTRTMVGRMNFVTSLLNGSLCEAELPYAPLEIVSRYGQGGDLTSCIRFFAERLTGAADEALIAEVQAAVELEDGSLEERVRQAIAMILARPEGVLG